MDHIPDNIEWVQELIPDLSARVEPDPGDGAARRSGRFAQVHESEPPANGSYLLRLRFSRRLHPEPPWWWTRERWW